MSLTSDVNEEDVPPCCCEMPCATTWMEEWFCPARISIARKCPRTGRKFQYPEGHTITLDWFAYRKNFNYLYCGAMGRVFVIKRADFCTPITGRIELPCWQVTNVTSMWGTVKSPVSSLEVGEMNSIVLDIHYVYVVSAFWMLILSFKFQIQS